MNGARKREGELTLNEIPFRLDQISPQLHKHSNDDTHDQATIDRRNQLNERTQRGMRQRVAIVRELERERGRLTAVRRRLPEYPEGTTIAQLGADVLVECEYERRSA